MSKKPKYQVSRNGSSWCVYEMKYNPNGSASGTKVNSHDERLPAIKEMFKLNGWNHKNLK